MNNDSSSPEKEISLIDIFKLFFVQWRVLAGITLTGTLVAFLVSVIIPKSYDIEARIIYPSDTDTQILNTNGYQNFSGQDVFNRVYEKLRSPDEFRKFLASQNWVNKVAHEGNSLDDKEFAELYEDFSVKVLEPIKKKGEPNDLPPTRLGINLSFEDEVLGVIIINGFVDYLNQYVINLISEQGKALRDLEKNRINLDISAARALESRNRANRLVAFKDAYNLAEAMGIKKPTTVELLAQSNLDTKNLFNIGGGANNNIALMGTEYLANEIRNLQKTENIYAFIDQLPELKKQFSSKQTDEERQLFLEEIANDPYIVALPGMLNRLYMLDRITFDFSGAHAFRIDKTAIADGISEKPKRGLIVALGFVLSAMIAVLYVLIRHGLNKRSDRDL